MPLYVAFLRAINVGGHTVRMAELRAFFEVLGHTSVETFIASGNVVFDAANTDAGALERAIEPHLRAALGYDVRTFVRTTAQVARVAGHDAFGAPLPDGHALMIAFVKGAPSAEARERLAAASTDVDDFRVDGSEVYWRIRGRVSDSRFAGPAFERALGGPATVRSVTTVRRLAAKYPPAGGAAA